MVGAIKSITTIPAKDHLQLRKLQRDQSRNDCWHSERACYMWCSSRLRLGPTLWDVAKVSLPPEVQLICYADFTSVVGCADFVAKVKSRVDQLLKAISHVSWIEFGSI